MDSKTEKDAQGTIQHVVFLLFSPPTFTNHLLSHIWGRWAARTGAVSSLTESDFFKTANFQVGDMPHPPILTVW